MVQNTSVEILSPETDVMTGGSSRDRYLLYQLLISMRKAKRIDIIVSFLMESGVKMLVCELENALEWGAKVRILTGNYLGITQPSALYLLKHRLGDRADLLEEGGAAYISFKSGVKTGEDQKGRYFTNVTEGTLREMADRTLDLKIAELWNSEDQMQRKGFSWLNVIFQHS